MKAICGECGGKREPYRPVTKHLDAMIDLICKRCWNLLVYAPFMWDEMTPEDQLVMRKYR